MASCAISTVDALQKTPDRYSATGVKYLPGCRVSGIASVTYSDRGSDMLDQFMRYQI